MTRAAKSSAPNPGRRPSKAAVTYRGIVLQPTPEPKRFTREQLKKAVEAAIAKNADFFAGRTSS